MKKLIQTIIFLLISANVWGQPICPLDGSAIKPKEVGDLSALNHIAILENGRIKPLDSYARNILLQLSGRRTFDKKPALAWLTRLLFAPDTTKDDKIFLINNPSIAEALGIEVEKNVDIALINLNQIMIDIQQLSRAAEQIQAKERDVVETELIRLNNNLKLFSSLSLSFSFAYPNQAFTLTSANNLKALNLPTTMTQFSYLDLAFRANELSELTKPLERIKPTEWSEEQKELITIVTNLFEWGMVYRDLPLQIVPSYLPNDTAWYSPWDASAIGLSKDQGRAELMFLRDTMVAYWNGQQLDFDLAVKNYSNAIKQRYEMTQGDKIKNISLEVLYNKLNLFFYAKVLYILCFLLSVIGFAYSKSWLRNLCFMFISIAFCAHTIALIMRIIILARPPVSNLYETFIFVGFVSVLFGLIVERMNKAGLGNTIASISGYCFLAIAAKFATEGDTLQMLVAVLNSNFWLGTHVLSITIGYAGACVAGIVGHFYILQLIFNARDKKRLDATYRVLLGSLGFALTMTFLGTNLGGIWADQSWGRFWGWDPKENGALLIILWLAILFHAKIARMIGPLGLAVGSALGIIVVMWAWFGVNLLSIGLHSYGFTSGLARNLTIYVICQLLFVCITFPLAKRKLTK